MSRLMASLDDDDDIVDVDIIRSPRSEKTTSEGGFNGIKQG
jgi:hypothetical protein